MVVNLPEKIGQRERDHDGYGHPEPAAGENPALRREHQGDQHRDKEENFIGLVFEAEAGAYAEHDPPVPDDALRIREGLRLDDANEGERAGQPEDGLEGIHREIAVDAQVDARDRDAQHSERSGGAPASHGPHQRSGEKHLECAGDSGDEPE